LTTVWPEPSRSDWQIERGVPRDVRKGKKMTMERLVWEERLVEDQGTTVFVGEDPHMCCRGLYAIEKINDAFQLFALYADPDDRVRHDNVFAAVSNAKAAAEAAYERLLHTDFLDPILEYECYMIHTLERKHRPGCENVARAAALLGCPEGEPPVSWLIEHDLLVKTDRGYHLTAKAIRIGIE
jgi:hypothetical protein